MRANYNSSALPGVKRNSLGKFLAIFLSLFFFVSFMTTFIEPSVVRADDSGSDKGATWLSDPIRKFSCVFGEGEIPDLAYQVAYTDYIPYNLFSKSAISSHVSRVDYFYNWMIDLSKGKSRSETSFKKVNEVILGTTLTSPITTDEVEYEETLEFNGGPTVSVYDRFGLAGLNWTGYKGEFKSTLVNTCGNLEATRVLNGEFYEGRKTPQSSPEKVADSDDPRSGLISGFPNDTMHSFGLVVSNWVFGLTKMLVALTITLVNLSFTNLVDLLGINVMLTGEDGKTGLVGSLFANVFQSFIVIVMVFTALNIMYLGLIKRAFRNAMGVLARTIALFIISVIIFANPAWFIALPNTIAVIGQSIVISALGNGIAGGYGLCDTDISAKVGGITDTNATVNTNFNEASSILEEASVNMSSAIGCQMWYTFAFRPWVEGQWGASYENLWAEDADTPISGKQKTLGNSNGEWVGDAAVPLGGGKFVNNWAVFNLSTNTNAHAPLGLEGERSKYTTNVANDWWRTVDAISNYETAPIDLSDVPGGADEATEEVPAKNIEVIEYWEKWTGSESTVGKLGTAVNALLVGVIGLAGPLFFALLSSILAIELAILMAFSPLMFLFGCWADKGWEIFKGWGELVINTTLTRIVVGILMSISIVMTMAIIKIMETGGAGNWFKGVVLLLLATLMLIKSRKKISEMLASIKFSSVDLSSTHERAKQMMAKTTKSGTGLARGAYAGARGATAARKSGVLDASRARGAWSGMKREMKNQSYTSNSRLVAAAREQAQVSRVKELGQKGFFGGEDAIVCQMCRKSISEDEMANSALFLDKYGNYYCQDCWEAGDTPDEVTEITYEGANSHKFRKTEASSKSKSVVNQINPNLYKLKKHYESANEKARIALLKESSRKIGESMGDLKKGREASSDDFEMVVPDFLSGYINKDKMKEATIDFAEKAAKGEDVSLVAEDIAQAYATAITKYIEVHGDSDLMSVEEITQDIVNSYYSVSGSGSPTP